MASQTSKILPGIQTQTTDTTGYVIECNKYSTMGPGGCVRVTTKDIWSLKATEITNGEIPTQLELQPPRESPNIQISPHFPIAQNERQMFFGTNEPQTNFQGFDYFITPPVVKLSPLIKPQSEDPSNRENFDKKMEVTHTMDAACETDSPFQTNDEAPNCFCKKQINKHDDLFPDNDTASSSKNSSEDPEIQKSCRDFNIETNLKHNKNFHSPYDSSASDEKQIVSSGVNRNEKKACRLCSSYSEKNKSYHKVKRQSVENVKNNTCIADINEVNEYNDNSLTNKTLHDYNVANDTTQTNYEKENTTINEPNIEIKGEREPQVQWLSNKKFAETGSNKEHSFTNTNHSDGPVKPVKKKCPCCSIYVCYKNMKYNSSNDSSSKMFTSAGSNDSEIEARKRKKRNSFSKEEENESENKKSCLNNKIKHSDRKIERNSSQSKSKSKFYDMDMNFDREYSSADSDNCIMEIDSNSTNGEDNEITSECQEMNWFSINGTYRKGTQHDFFRSSESNISLNSETSNDDYTLSDSTSSSYHRKSRKKPKQCCGSTSINSSKVPQNCMKINSALKLGSSSASNFCRKCMNKRAHTRENREKTNMVNTSENKINNTCKSEHSKNEQLCKFLQFRSDQTNDSEILTDIKFKNKCSSQLTGTEFGRTREDLKPKITCNVIHSHTDTHLAMKDDEPPVTEIDLKNKSFNQYLANCKNNKCNNKTCEIHSGSDEKVLNIDSCELSQSSSDTNVLNKDSDMNIDGCVPAKCYHKCARKRQLSRTESGEPGNYDEKTMQVDLNNKFSGENVINHKNKKSNKTTCKHSSLDTNVLNTYLGKPSQCSSNANVSNKDSDLSIDSCVKCCHKCTRKRHLSSIQFCEHGNDDDDDDEDERTEISLKRKPSDKNLLNSKNKKSNKRTCQLCQSRSDINFFKNDSDMNIDVGVKGSDNCAIKCHVSQTAFGKPGNYDGKTMETGVKNKPFDQNLLSKKNKIANKKRCKVCHSRSDTNILKKDMNMDVKRVNCSCKSALKISRNELRNLQKEEIISLLFDRNKTDKSNESITKKLCVCIDTCPHNIVSSTNSKNKINTDVRNTGCEFSQTKHPEEKDNTTQFSSRQPRCVRISFEQDENTTKTNISGNLNEDVEEEPSIKDTIKNFITRYLWGDPLTRESSTQVDLSSLECDIPSCGILFNSKEIQQNNYNRAQGGILQHTKECFCKETLRSDMYENSTRDDSYDIYDINSEETTEQPDCNADFYENPLQINNNRNNRKTSQQTEKPKSSMSSETNVSTKDSSTQTAYAELHSPKLTDSEKSTEEMGDPLLFNPSRRRTPEKILKMPSNQDKRSSFPNTSGRNQPIRPAKQDLDRPAKTVKILGLQEFDDPRDDRLSDEVLEETNIHTNLEKEDPVPQVLGPPPPTPNFNKKYKAERKYGDSFPTKLNLAESGGLIDTPSKISDAKAKKKNRRSSEDSVNSTKSIRYGNNYEVETSSTDSDDDQYETDNMTDQDQEIENVELPRPFTKPPPEEQDEPTFESSAEQIQLTTESISEKQDKPIAKTLSAEQIQLTTEMDSENQDEPIPEKSSDNLSQPDLRTAPKKNKIKSRDPKQAARNIFHRK